MFSFPQGCRGACPVIYAPHLPQYRYANTCCACAGAKYSQYCGIVARTYLIDPNKQQEQEYAALVAATEAAVKALKPGAPCSDAYAAAVKALEVRPTPSLHGLKSG